MLGIGTLILALVGCAAPQAAREASQSAAPSVTRAEAERSDAVSDEAISAALDRAGPNRPEIERYLARYASSEDADQRTASRWLVANMPGHGFARMTLQRPDGTTVAFEATDHPNLAAANAALDALIEREGPLRFGLEGLTEDLTIITAEELIANHERAFESWRTAPWSSSIDLPTFLEHILPYRGSNEPLDLAWRAEAHARLAPALAALRASLDREPTLAEATQAARKAAKKWVRFRQLFYLHPTDQSWSEMMRSTAGRCEDQSNVAVFAARSIATVVAGDFTPFWADRDNNHAWEVALDANGTGSARLAHRPAKVYRRMFGVQPSSLGAMRYPGEAIPGGLGERTLLDVTAQYVDVTDISVAVGPPPAGQRFAYLCVFNAGTWRPVHHALVSEGVARFTAMGRDLLYLPSWHSPEGMVAAGAPFILAGDGSRYELTTGSEREPLVLTAEPGTTDASRELSVWSPASGQWMVLALPAPTAGAATITVDVPTGGLFWLRDPKGRSLERPFTIVDGTIRPW